jgi:two-component system response regulator PilR (NtrC family)
MSIQHVLIVDDEPDIRELLEITLSRMNLETRAAADLSQARSMLEQGRYDLCLTDMRLPDGNGIDLVRTIQQHHPDLPVAVITAYGSMDTAIEALKAGAFDFVSKPIDLAMLRGLVNSALRLKRENQTTQNGPEQLIGHSDAVLQLKATIQKLARSQAPVYVHGESGTGKELVARLIHSLGPRRDKPFIPVNCGAIPSELMESEFFGHKKGSFTGAINDRPGLFQSAQGGTLFLDEIAELPQHMQVKLLRAIQERAIRPVGATQEESVDVRIISATHKDLAREVENNRFREDLYYRINVIEVRVPPLRERIGDLPELATHVLDKIAARWGSNAPQLTTEALDRLRRYHFPGNVRELENILERAATLSEDHVIHAEHLSLRAPTRITQNPPSAEPPRFQISPEAGMERERIVQALQATRWNRTAAARQLGLTLRQLRYRMEKLGLD